MNKSVDFSTAKLLKEKGYGNTAPWKLGRDYYNHLGELNGDVTDYVRAFVKLKNKENRNELTHLETIDAPIIAEVLMWLYEKHGIWVVVNIDKPHLSKSCMFFGNVIKFGQHHKNKHRTIFYSTPTEAYEAAIEYCLTNEI